MRVGFYLSKDKLGIDADGAVGTDVSYRIDPDLRFTTVFEARSVKGVITPKKPLERLRLREPGSRFGFGQDLILGFEPLRDAIGCDEERSQYDGSSDARHENAVSGDGYQSMEKSHDRHSG